MESPAHYPPVWIDAVSQLNKVAGVVMAVGPAFVLGQTAGAFWAVVGLVGGGLAAILTCGTIALLLDIRQSLSDIKDKAGAL